LQNPEKTVIVINDLCTGVLETMILVAAIIATMEIHWKKRAIGAIAAIIGIFVFNQIRIISTVFFILNAPIDWVVLSHDLFFRVFLFITIAVFYWLFLKWGKEQSKIHKK
jgi:exosortase/archaeosortase family protein